MNPKTRKTILLQPNCRKALFNEAEVGLLEQIQRPVDQITSLRGVMYDIDPDKFVGGPFTESAEAGADQFYDDVVEHWISRHAVLNNAEVRATGTGLHVVLWVDPPIELKDEADRERLAARVQIIQAALPIDPLQPGIAATTRYLGSINSKNGATVRRIRKGTAITGDQLVLLCNDMAGRPFKTLSSILLGAESLTPCPLCGAEGSRLVAQDFFGRCYACGNVKVDSLLNYITGGANG